MFAHFRSQHALGLVLIGSLVFVSVNAQDKKEAAADKKAEAKQDAKAATKKADSGSKPAAREFRAKFDEWRGMLKKLGEIRARYDGAKESEIPAIKKEWETTISAGEKLIPPLREAARKAYLETPNKDRELTRFLVRLVEDSLRQDHYATTRALAETLITNDCPEKKVFDYAGMACFALHDFEKAVEYFTKAKEFGVLSDISVNYLKDSQDYIEHWKKEQEIRAAQKDKNLPLVKVTTTKGEVEIELFEEEAPGAVANFINLVEQGFYKDKSFHRVLTNFVAQGGCPNGNGSGGPGYTIYCECDPKEYPNYRKHFRGSLSMAHAGPNTGGSQFFMCFLPTANLNGKHTVFGRFTKGLEVLEKLQRIDPEKPKQNVNQDKIVKAEVIRKRDHDYVINKVGQ